MLSNELTAQDLNAHYKAVRARLMGSKKSNVLAFPTRKTNTRPNLPPYGPVLPIIPSFLISYENQYIPPPSPPILIEDIHRVVCASYGITKTDLVSNRRTKDVTLARQIACYLARKITTKSLPEIGRRTGGRDHTTIMHAVAKIEQLAAVDNSLSTELSILEHKIRNGEG